MSSQTSTQDIQTHLSFQESLNTLRQSSTIPKRLLNGKIVCEYGRYCHIEGADHDKTHDHTPPEEDYEPEWPWNY